MIPPAADSEFVACMEDVLETYKKPCDKRFPVLCMDEQSVQFLKETRVPIPASKEHARRVDYEYERNGTASIFMFAEPLKGWRQVRARPQRTKVDWALEIKELLTTRFAEAGKSCWSVTTSTPIRREPFMKPSLLPNKPGRLSSVLSFTTRPNMAVG